MITAIGAKNRIYRISGARQKSKTLKTREGNFAG
jgi:hypothetical protein